MQWIEYDYVCNAGKGINLHKKVEYNEANLAIAKKEAIGGNYTITDDGVEIPVKPLPIELGGTNAKTAAEARDNLGVTPSNIGAISKTGDAMTGVLTLKGIILTEGIDYGTLEQRPAPGVKGRIYFQKVVNKE